MSSKSRILTGLNGPETAARCAAGNNVLNGHALKRLSSLAATFGEDLRVLAHASWPRGHDVRRAMAAPRSVWLVPPEWAPVLRRVLVPIDFSERSAVCLRAAIELARPFPRSKCLALHVYRHDTRLIDDALDVARRRALAKRFAAFITGIDNDGASVELILAESHRIDREIARTGERCGVDLVVMNRRVRTRAARLVLPSITEEAIRQCRASFLVLKSSTRPVGFLQALRERWQRTDGLQFS